MQKAAPLNGGPAELPANLINGLVQRPLSYSFRRLEQIPLNCSLANQACNPDTEQPERHNVRRKRPLE